MGPPCLEAEGFPSAMFRDVRLHENLKTLAMQQLTQLQLAAGTVTRCLSRRTHHWHQDPAIVEMCLCSLCLHNLRHLHVSRAA